MKNLILKSLFILTLFFISTSCLENEKELVLCGEIECNYWQECKEDICVLDTDFCNTKDDCSDQEICGSNHKCKQPESCQPECKSWEYCDDNQCKLQVSRCNDISDCGDINFECQENFCKKIDLCKSLTCWDNSTCKIKNDEAKCICNTGFELQNERCIAIDKCSNVNCQDHASCNSNNGECECDNGYTPDGESCIAEDACGGCSGHGTCLTKEDNDHVCACDTGFTPGDLNRTGLDCVPTNTVCKGGEINLDVNGDGTNETWFEPNATECDMFEAINYIRAFHDKEESAESHKPLKYNVVFSAWARMHSIKMSNGSFEHGDMPPGWRGQNIAYGCGVLCEMGMYMGCGDATREPICKSAREPHCPGSGHHCNIMKSTAVHVGVGMSGTYNTQNF